MMKLVRPSPAQLPGYVAALRVERCEEPARDGGTEALRFRILL
jgi:hypothetical protein